MASVAPVSGPRSMPRSFAPLPGATRHGRAGATTHAQPDATNTDRQGHAHFGLHAGERTLESNRLDRRRRGAARAGTIDRGLPDACQRAEAGGGDQRQPQSLPDNNGIKFFSARAPAARRLGAKSGRCWPSAAVGQCRCPGARAASSMIFAGRYISSARALLPRDLPAARTEDRGRWRHGAAARSRPKVFHELGADVLASAARPTA